VEDRSSRIHKLQVDGFDDGRARAVPRLAIELLPEGVRQMLRRNTSGQAAFSVTAAGPAALSRAVPFSMKRMSSALIPTWPAAVRMKTACGGRVINAQALKAVMTPATIVPDIRSGV
jgi:hypothetical protein